ncbi:MAG TPA: FAD binding domain-containing protein, partial [Bryobacteraceae bacterium]|nr:FAD binding domain-containing protein [Bryobacteraceae bacterium]
MKTFSNANARDLKQAVSLAGQARRDGKTVAFAGGGSDLLGLVKERIIAPDVIVHLRGVKGLDRIEANGKGLTMGGQVTLDAISHHPVIRSQY